MGVTVNHAFTSPVGDATGTITVLNTNGLTTTANAAQIIKPSNWNDNHIVQIDGYAGTGFSGTNISGTVDSNGISLSVAPGGGGGADGFNILAAGTQTAGTNVTVNFANSNGISFGMSNSSQITASYTTLPIATNVNDVRATASTGTAASYAPADHVHAGVRVLVAGSNTGNTAGNTIARHGDWVVAGSNNITINGSTGAGGVHTVWVSGPTLTPYLTTAALSNHSHGNPTLNLTNISGTTASNSAGLTLSLSAGAIPTVTQYFSATNTTFNGTNVSGSITLNTNGFRIDLSAPTPGGGGAINVSAGTTSGNLQTIQFNNGNGVTFGLNGSTVTASVNAGGGAAATQSKYAPYADINGVIGQIGNGTIIFDPDWMPNLHMDRVLFPVNYTAASNSSGSFTVSMLLGLYTQNASTLSLMHSTSVTLGITNSGTVGSYSLFSGLRHISAPWSTTITEGQYFIAMGSRTTTGGAAGMSMSNFLISNINTNFVGFMGASHNTTMQYLLGQGVYSATSSELPGSVAFSQIRGSDSAAFRSPKVLFQLGTA